MSADTLLLHDDILPESFIGTYYDGQSSLARPVSTVLMGAHVALFGEGWTRRVPVNEIRVSEPLERAPVVLRISDGSVCELPASPLLLGRLRQSGLKPTVFSVWQGDMRLVLLTLAFLAAMIAVLYLYALPLVAQVGAAAVPPQVKARIGKATLAALDARWFAPTRLPTAQQQAIAQRFDELSAASTGKPLARLELRAVRQGPEGAPLIGPNAFALPGRTVVLTDAMVAELRGDLDALSGVLAHELGHVLMDHPMQSLIHASAGTGLSALLLGDLPGLVATAPALLVQLRYGRAAEQEADTFAHDLLCIYGLQPSRLADVLLAPKGASDSALPTFLRSHPPNAERAALLRRDCALG